MEAYIEHRACRSGGRCRNDTANEAIHTGRQTHTQRLDQVGDTDRQTDTYTATRPRRRYTQADRHIHNNKAKEAIQTGRQTHTQRHGQRGDTDRQTDTYTTTRPTRRYRQADRHIHNNVNMYTSVQTFSSEIAACNVKLTARVNF